MEEVGNMKILWVEVTHRHTDMSVTRFDTNKNFEENPENRSRRDTRHFRSVDNLFTPTTQWEIEATDVV